MSLSSDDHVTLLLSCIQHSTGGKIDFAAVARDCNITSAGAASKRYSRLTKSHRDGMANGEASASASTGGTNNTNNTGTQRQSGEPTNTTDQSQVQPIPADPGRKRKVAAPKKADEAPPARKRGRPAGKAAKGTGKENLKHARVKVKEEEGESKGVADDNYDSEGQGEDSEMTNPENADC
ncbi:hypothetical protein BDV12DRAFT_199500 [Aspergillus spectabilis]